MFVSGSTGLSRANIGPHPGSVFYLRQASAHRDTEAQIETHYHSDRRRKNDQQQMNDIPPTIATLSSTPGFREDYCQVTASDRKQQCAKPRNTCSTRIPEPSLRRFPYVEAVLSGRS